MARSALSVRLVRPPGPTASPSLSLDNTAKVWDAESGEEFFTLAGHTAVVRSVAFSPDGTRLATASDDRTAKVWDAGSGEELLTLAGHTSRVQGDRDLPLSTPSSQRFRMFVYPSLFSAPSAFSAVKNITAP